jgi:hypothetical protein
MGRFPGAHLPPWIFIHRPACWDIAASFDSAQYQGPRNPRSRRKQRPAGNNGIHAGPPGHPMIGRGQAKGCGMKRAGHGSRMDQLATLARITPNSHLPSGSGIVPHCPCLGWNSSRNAVAPPRTCPDGLRIRVRGGGAADYLAERPRYELKRNRPLAPQCSTAPGRPYMAARHTA